MSEMNKEKMVWIDLETTGLDPEMNRILEVACIITDNDLDTLFSGQWGVQRTAQELESMSEWCRTQHTKSGLVQACLDSNIALYQVDRELAEIIEEHGAVNAPLCGSSAHFDRKFIVPYMPKVREKLHYRNFDVSTIKQAWERWLPHIEMSIPEKKELHRGLPDLEDSIALARVYRESLLRHQGECDD